MAIEATTRGFWLLLGAVGGGLIGGALGVVVAGRTLPETRTGENAVSSDLASAVRSFSEEVRRLRESPPTPSMARAIAESRENAQGNVPASNAEQLLTAIEQLTASVQAIGAVGRSVGTGSVGLRIPATSRAPETFRDIRRESRQQLSQSHFGWTYQQMLDRYGLPDHATERPGGVAWIYEVKGNPETQVCSFVFADGVVVRAEY